MRLYCTTDRIDTAVPSTISATPIANEPPACGGCTSGRIIFTNNPKRSTAKPSAISVSEVRVQASNVRSAANSTRGSSRLDMGSGRLAVCVIAAARVEDARDGALAQTLELFL